MGKPCIWWVHESQFGVEYSRQYPFVPGAFRAADVLAFPTRATASLYREYASEDKEDKIEILRPGLNTEKLTRPPGKNVDRRLLKIVNVASYEPRKGQDIQVRSLDKLPAEIEIECELIGRKLDWWFSQKLSFSARSRPVLKVLGELPNPDVLAHIGSADIFVLPSRDEALPVTLLEAMYFSKAIIASRSGGIPEVIEHGVNGLIFDVEDVYQLRDCIIELYQDRDYLEKLGQRGRETLMNELSVNVQGKRWVQIIESLIQREKSNRDRKEILAYVDH
jgi:glycosyltransferase involved in cell wall biosynthesis